MCLGKIQWNMLEVLCRDVNDIKYIDMNLAEKLIDEMVVPYLEHNNIDLNTVSHHHSVRHMAKL